MCCFISNAVPSSTAGYVMQLGPQKRLIPETSPAEDEPAANVVPCVSSLNAVQILDQMESIFALLNGC
ncbi:hypothetical protein TB1_034162 [Malus domestica]